LLDGWTEVSVSIPDKWGGKTRFSSSDDNGSHAEALYDGATYRSVEEGIGGNQIKLYPNGVKDIKQLLLEWNSLYPNLQAEYLSDDLILSGHTVTFHGGMDTIPAVIAEAKYFGVPFEAMNTGVVGNTIELVFDGVAVSVEDAIATWDLAFPLNTVVEKSGETIPPYGVAVFTGGLDLVLGASATATWEDVVFTSINKTLDANSIVLVTNGVDDLDTIVGNWNIANPTNEAGFNGDSLTLTASVVNLAGGSDPIIEAKSTAASVKSCVFTAVNFGVAGNSIVLTYDGSTDSIISQVNSWNSANIGNEVSSNADTLVIAGGDLILSGGTDSVGDVFAKATHVNVTFVADTLGSAGDGIVLKFNGIDETVSQIVTTWNTNNVGNTISHNGHGWEVLPFSEIVLSGGTDATNATSATGSYLGITFVSDPLEGTNGNMTVTFDGVLTIKETLDAQEILSNVPITYDTDNYILDAETLNLSGGLTTSNGTAATATWEDVVFTCTTVGVTGNGISLTFGSNDILSVINSWDMANPTGPFVSYDAGGVILSTQTLNLAGGLLEIPATGSSSNYHGYNYLSVGVGAVTNDIRLHFTGEFLAMGDTVDEAIANWNDENPTNTCISNVKNQVLPLGVVSLIGGIDTKQPTRAVGKHPEGVEFLATNSGTPSNSIKLYFNNINTLGYVVDEWNNNNPQMTCSDNIRNQIPKIGIIELSGGTENKSKVKVIDETLGIVELNLNEEDTQVMRLGDGQNIHFEVSFDDFLRRCIGWNVLDVR